MKYALPVALVLLCVGAWYSDLLLESFAHRPKAADIAGSWRLDEEEHARLADQVSRTVPEGAARDKYRAALLAGADPYRNVVYTFAPDGYSTTGPAGEHAFTATYEGFPPNSLAIKPEGERAMAIIIDAPGKRITINQPMVGIPLKPAE